MRGTPGLLRLRLAMYGDTFFPGSWPPSPVTTHTLSPKVSHNKLTNRLGMTHRLSHDKHDSQTESHWA